jgi:hypothetical protein
VPGSADIRWLIGPEGAAWLDRLGPDAAATPAVVAGLRRDLSADRVHLLLEQIELRRRAREKFASAGRMFFNRVGLEQATDEDTAAWKARRFPAGERVADLCCGLGGDLLALAARGPALGIERDECVALLAEANVRSLEYDANQTTVRVEDAASFDVGDFSAWHIDPDRRPAGRRTTRVELHQPGPDVIERLLVRCPAGAVKLAPAATLPDGWEARAELEWISRDGQCRQLVAWFGALAARPGARRATMLASAERGAGKAEGEVPRMVCAGPPYIEPPLAPGVGRYLFEPDNAILAAGLTGVLAAEHGLAAIAPGIAYLTGDAPLADRALACFLVTDVLPFDLRRVQSLLRQRGIGRLEIKKRGAPHDPAEVRRRLQPSGDGQATLILTRIAGRVMAIMATRPATTDV